MTFDPTAHYANIREGDLAAMSPDAYDVERTFLAARLYQDPLISNRRTLGCTAEQVPGLPNSCGDRRQ